MKKLYLILALVFIVPCFVFGCSSKEVELSSYTISSSYDEKNQSLSCEQNVVYFNNAESALDSICFFLYANSFAEEKEAVSVSYKPKAYPNGESFGNIEIEAVFENKNASNFFVNENGNILEVKLENVLYPEEKVSIDLKYTVFLANVNHRLGYGENCVNFGNFFPILCVYEEVTGFVKTNFSANGDPFYSDVSNFEVEISFPSDYTLASSGEQKQVSVNQNSKTAKCVAKKVRDFSFILSKKFQVLSQKVEDTEVCLYSYDDELMQKHLQTAVDALETFQKCFGKYPYQKLSVVKTNFCFGGMEYPNLVMISDAITENEVINYVIVHEIAHQWWYGVVGNNEFDEAWIDEGLTEYSTALFFKKNQQYGIDYETIIDNAKESYKNFVSIYSKVLGNVEQSTDRSLTQFATEPEYVNCVYTKGMLMFASLSDTLGENRFLSCLKKYYKANEFKNVSKEVLIDDFSKFSHINLTKYFKSWLDGNVVFN